MHVTIRTIVADQRYFQTARGRIVAELRRRRSATAHELADAFGVSANAIRQHLAGLSREGVVSEKPIRRGPTKPTFEYALTAEADALFPQRYDKLLNAVLREVREQHGDDGVRDVFAGIAQRMVVRHAPMLAMGSAKARVEGLAEVLRQQGVEVTVEQPDAATIVLSEHNCPYALNVSEHREVCTIVHGLFTSAAPHGYRQTTSLADGDASCRFEVQTAAD